MKDLFCTYEQSLAIRELGFDEPCIKLWEKTEFFTSLVNPESFKKVVKERFVNAPLKSQFFKWVREKHNIDAWMQPFMSLKSNQTPYLPDESYSYYIFKDGVFVSDGVDFNEPEQAEDACINKLIEIIV